MGNQVELPLDGSTHCWKHEFRVDLLITVDQDNAQCGWDKLSFSSECDIIALADVVDVDRNRRVSSNS